MTTEQFPGAAGTVTSGHTWLRVLTTQGVQSFVLPPVGSLVVGRGEEAEIRIDDRSVSRRHAVLHLGRTLQLEALTSSNGTHVRGVLLAPGDRTDVEPGDVITLGAIPCLLEGRSKAERPRRFWTHGYFEGRLEDECARAADARAGFAVLQVRVDGRADPNFASDLLSAVRATDVVAVYVPGEYEILRSGATPDDAEGLAGDLSARLARPGRSVRVGAACYPRDGRAPEALLAAARATLREPAEKGAAPTDDIVVEDGAMRRLLALVDRVAQGVINVLLLGETGVGKEVFAARVHACSTRAAKPYVRFNCAAFSESLVESELFGHEKGAFSGAVVARTGLLESAQGGTVFLDEVGELPMSLQAKLLRVLEERRFRRVGGDNERTLDVRIVAATNRDLEAEIAAGRFRSDLYFRLNGISLVIPALRARTGEIEALARRFVALAAAQNGMSVPPELSPEALGLLRRYAWPGNIRELRNTMDRAVLLAWDGPILAEHLPVEKMAMVVPCPPSSVPSREAAGRPSPVPGAIGLAKDAAERGYILDALERCNGNQAQAASLLGISRRTLINKLERHGLPRPRKDFAAPKG